MAYCTMGQVEDRYGTDNLTTMSDVNRDQQPDSDVVDRAIADASALMDAYLQKKFVVPIPAPVPPVLVGLCITLTWCNLLRGRRSMTEDARKDCDDAIKTLEGIVAGDIEIGLVPKPAESAGAPGVRHDVQDRVFGRDHPL